MTAFSVSRTEVARAAEWAPGVSLLACGRNRQTRCQSNKEFLTAGVSLGALSLTGGGYQVVAPDGDFRMGTTESGSLIRKAVAVLGGDRGQVMPIHAQNI